MAKKVLVISEEPEVLTALRGPFCAAGFEVSTCENGRQALEEIRRLKPDLLILDLFLPGVDGFSLQNKISQDTETSGLPIIILSSLESAKALFVKVPQVVGFLTKPFNSEELLQAALKAVPQFSGAQ